MIPDGMQMTVAVFVALILGTVFGMLVKGAFDNDRVDAAFLRGRNVERIAHGEEPLQPAPRFEPAEDNLWRIGS